MFLMVVSSKKAPGLSLIDLRGLNLQHYLMIKVDVVKKLQNLASDGQTNFNK